MKKWKKEINLQVPIEFAWPYFYGNLEKKRAIFPKIETEEYTNTTTDVVGTTFKQTYKNGSISESYNIQITKFEDTAEYKVIEESFILNNRFKMTTTYELTNQPDGTTLFTYTSVNKPKNPLLILFQLFGKDDIIVSFMNRTKQTIEGAYNPTDQAKI